MKKKYLSIFFLLTFLFVLFILLIYNKENYNILSVKNGVLDLSEWKENNDCTIKLSGKWDFYWNKLLSKEDIKNQKNKLMVEIPSVWSTYSMKGKKLPGFGFGTYHLLVKNAKVGQPMAIMIPPLSTAYRFILDDEILNESGIVSENQGEAKTGYSLEVITFTPWKKDFHIILQVSNYAYARGGMWDKPQLGTPENINKINRDGIFRDFFLIGSYFVMLIFIMIMYSFQRNEKKYLYFSLICICIIIRIIFNGYSFIQAFPFVANVSYAARADYIGANWTLIGFIYLCDIQYTNKKLEVIKKIAWIYCLMCTFMISITPLWFFTRFKFFIQGFIAVIVICYMYELIKTAIKVKRISKIFILFFSFFFICALFEISIQSNLIDGDYSEFFLIGSFCLFLLVNMAMIKNFFTTIKTREEALIERKNAKQKEYEAELNFLKSQIRPHFIHNALNAIISISRRDADQSRSLLVDFSSYLRNCFEFENSGNLVSIDREINFVRSYIAIEKARFGDKLHIYYEIETQDLLIPPLILQPLVENAVQHGIRDKEGEGTIIVYVHIQGDLACIGVKDDGVGISAEIINNVLEGVRNTRGIGLYNINQRLNKIYHTSLQIENLEDGGTNISMLLPFNT